MRGASDERCHYNPGVKSASDKGFEDICSGSEKALKKGLTNVGPVIVAIDASHDHESFQVGVKEDIIFK